ncbi:MAG TPA: hypothetical protein VMW47_11215 [Verrucomicrobiae bacterium]|nr:hypothetical protein [Verrucomicrobiae bacterium]
MVSVGLRNFLVIGVLGTAFLAVMGLIATFWAGKNLPGTSLLAHFPFVPLSIKSAAGA